MNKIYREIKKHAVDNKIQDYPIIEVKVTHEEKTIELLLRKDANYISKVGFLEFCLRNNALEGDKSVELTTIPKEGKVLLKYENILELLSTMTEHSFISAHTQKTIEKEFQINFYDEFNQL